MRPITSLGVFTSVVITSSLLTPVSHAATTDYSADATWVVPSGVSVVQVMVSGGTGGGFPGSSDVSPATGGVGYKLTAGLTVTSGETIHIGLGTNGGDSPRPTALNPAGAGGTSAFGISGGDGGSNAYGSGAGGGGASAVAVGDTIVMIAGGGGGAGYSYYSGIGGAPSAGLGGGWGFLGGNGGDGSGGSDSPDGGGGRAGNVANATSPCDLNRTTSCGGGGVGGVGKSRFSLGGGGGGGGYYGGIGGGGGGNDPDEFGSSGGGAGSSYTSTTRIPTTNYSTVSAAVATPRASISYIDFQTTSLPAARVDSAYTATLAATFGLSTSPDAWAVSPALPGGLTLDPNSGAITGTPTTAATGTHTFTATKYGSGSLISARSSIDLALTVSADPALTPAFGAVTSTADGFTFSVTNFDASYTWGATSSAGSVTVSGAGLVTVSGIGAGASATVTVTTQRSGYLSGSAQQTGSASTTSTPSNGITENTQSNDSPVTPPRLTAVPPGLFTWNQGVYGRTRVIENSGGVAQYTIKPELPQGMSIDRGTGIIQGSPVNALASTTFIVEARNTSGSSTAKVRLQVEVATTKSTVAEDGTAGTVRFRKYSAKLTKTVLVRLRMVMQNLGLEPVTLTGMIPASGQGATLARKRAVQVRKHLRSQGMTVGPIILLSEAPNLTMTRRVLLTKSSMKPSD